MNSYPSPLRSWSVVAILLLTAILAYTDRQVLSLLVDPMREDLGISDMQISLLFGTAFAVTYGTAGIPLGWLADRLSRRLLIFAGVVVWSIATLCCGLAHSFLEVFAARIVVGLGEAVLSPAAISLISDYFPPHRRGTVVGVYLSGIAIGIGSSLLIGGAVLQAIDHGLMKALPFDFIQTLPPWRMVLLVLALPGFLWSLVILSIREPERRKDGGEALDLQQGETAPKGWGRIVSIYIVVAMASLVDNAVGAWAPSLLIRNFHQDPSAIGIELGLLLMVGFGGGVLAGGILADRAARQGGWYWKLRLCLFAVLAILPLALLVDSGNFLIVLLAVPLYFACSGIVTACGFSAILDLVPHRHRGVAMAISFFLNVAIGGGLGPAAVTLAGEHLFSPGAGLGPPLTLTMLSAELLVAALLWRRLKN